MKYCWNSTIKDNTNHIVRFNNTGDQTGKSLCGIEYNRSINAPFKLGRKTCETCLSVRETH